MVEEQAVDNKKSDEEGSWRYVLSLAVTSAEWCTRSDWRGRPYRPRRPGFALFASFSIVVPMATRQFTDNLEVSNNVILSCPLHVYSSIG